MDLLNVFVIIFVRKLCRSTGHKVSQSFCTVSNCVCCPRSNVKSLMSCFLKSEMVPLIHESPEARQFNLAICKYSPNVFLQEMT